MYSVDVAGRTTYTFDASGNRKGVLKPDGSRTTTSYDFENRDLVVQLPSNIRNTMAYDPNGLRVLLEDSSGTTKFIWDRAAYLSELDNANATKAIFAQEPGGYGGLVSQYRFSGSLWLPNYYHYDSLGNTTELTDDTETVTDTDQYDAFGVLLSKTGSTINPFQFGGLWSYYTDPDTGHLYIRARTYLPWQGRWTSVDGLLFIDGPNVYVAYFVPNWIDPSGKKKICGLYAWLYAGKGIIPPLNISNYCVDDDVYNDALDAAARVVSCWWDCEVTIHKCIAGIAADIAGGTAVVSFTHLPIAKLASYPRGIGSGDLTSLQRVLSVELRRRGLGTKMLTQSANEVKQFPLESGIKSFIAGVTIVEAGFSAYCGMKCS